MRDVGVHRGHGRGGGHAHGDGPSRAMPTSAPRRDARCCSTASSRLVERLPTAARCSRTSALCTSASDGALCPRVPAHLTRRRRAVRPVGSGCHPAGEVLTDPSVHGLRSKSSASRCTRPYSSVGRRGAGAGWPGEAVRGGRGGPAGRSPPSARGAPSRARDRSTAPSTGRRAVRGVMAAEVNSQSSSSHAVESHGAPGRPHRQLEVKV